MTGIISARNIRHDEKTTNADPKNQNKWFNDVSGVINFCSNDKSTLEVSSSAVDIFQSFTFILLTNLELRMKNTAKTI